MYNVKCIMYNYGGILTLKVKMLLFLYHRVVAFDNNCTKSE